MKNAVRLSRKGFTLIELLVVVAIIALLVSILMPALGQAKFQAKRVFCLSNIKSQHLSQMMYATDNDGRFALRVGDWGPVYTRCGQPEGSGYCREVMDDYITDSGVLLCPLQKTFGGPYSDTEFWDAGDSGWDGVDPGTGDPGLYVFMGYNWFANSLSTPWGDVIFDGVAYGIDSAGTALHEPPWPKKDSECTASRAFITHMITYSPTVGYGLWWDTSHGGRADPIYEPDQVLSEATESEDNPVGYADGHAGWTPRARLKARAINPNGSTEVYY